MKQFATIFASLTAVFALVTVAAAATSVIRPSDLQGWGIVEETSTASGQFVTGPDTAPMGNGSVELTTDNGGVIVTKEGYNGTKLADIDSLSYSTYRQVGGSAVAIALQFNIDNDVTDADNAWKGRLVFEPYYTETVNTGEWQTWDPMTQGKWWGTGAAISGTCSMASPCTWDEVLTAFPNIGIHNTFGAVVLKAGSGWGDFTGNVDALSISVNGVEDVYDFEADLVLPQTKDDCKNNGWQIYTDMTFKNQGQCIAYVVSSPNSAHHN